MTTSSLQSLTDYMHTVWRDTPHLEGLSSVVSNIALGAQDIQAKVQLAALASVIGTTGAVNVQGEVVQILDEAASSTFVDALSRSGRVAAIGCEEIETTVIVGDSEDKNYLVQMDPLDGSSNIDVAISIGSIFGIWKRNPNEQISEATMFRPGNEQVAAVYAVYGSSTMLVVAVEGSVQGFTLDPASRDFILTHPDVVLPEKCPYYSLNEGNFKKLEGATKTAEGFNPLCGDQITLYLKLDDGVIKDISFEGVGCAISKASASMMTEEIVGKTPSEAAAIFGAFQAMVTGVDAEYDEEILGDLGILRGVSQYPVRIKCATLSWHTLQSALSDSEKITRTE